MKRLNQTGSHLIGIALLVVVLGLVAFAGYTVSHRNSKTTKATATAGAKTTVAPASIKNSADLQQTASALDSAASQLNASLDDSGMNADLNSML